MKRADVERFKLCTGLSRHVLYRVLQPVIFKQMGEIKDLLEEFVDWAKDCGEDAWYIFDNTEEAIERFLKQREQLFYYWL